jgi:hypothetical protein
MALDEGRDHAEWPGLSSLRRRSAETAARALPVGLFGRASGIPPFWWRLGVPGMGFTVGGEQC